jgi:hypothetical protein
MTPILVCCHALFEGNDQRRAGGKKTVAARNPGL